jgi:transcriptional regulatory protein GAL4
MDPPGASHARSREIEHSCTECRRRKAKCDRAQPQCSNCSRHTRSCSYEKPVKTPLTRKYVAELELELAQAQELLRRSSTPAGSAINGHTLAEVNGSSQHDSGAGGRIEEGANVGMLFTPAAPSQAAMVVAPRSIPNTNGSQTRIPAPKFVRYASSSQTTKPSPTFSFEAPPASDDFDWDERNVTVSNGDGMASLTTGSSRGGYLGVASGAALLRLADTDAQATSAYDIGDDIQAGDESMRNTPIPKAIYTLSQLEPFVDAYFSLYHVSYPIVHEATFRAQVSCCSISLVSPTNRLLGNLLPCSSRILPFSVSTLHYPLLVNCLHLLTSCS